MAVSTITVKPAAGPDTLMCEPLMAPTITPPIMPESSPEKRLAPEAKAIPKQSGKATKATTSEAGKSYLRVRNGFFEFITAKKRQQVENWVLKNANRHTWRVNDWKLT